MASEKEKPFIEDIFKKNLLHAQLVRAGSLVGEITQIEIPKSLLQDSDLVIAGADDIPGRKTIDVDGDAVPLFAESEVSYPGQPVLIAAHPDQRKLDILIKSIKIIVKPRDKFLIGNSLPKESEIKERIIAQSKHQNEAAEKAIATADSLIINQYYTGMQEHYYSGHQGVIVEPVKEGLNITCSTEWPHLIRQNVAELFNYSHEQVSIQNAKKSPSFGGKLWFPALLACQATLISRKAKKGIRLIFYKKEDLLFTTKRAPMVIHRINALDKNKNLIASKTEIVIEGGAFPVFTQTMLETAIFALNGSYRQTPKTLSIQIIKTDRPSMDFFSGSGIAPILFAIERDQDQLAIAAGTDPLTWRIENLSKEAQSGKLGQILKECVNQSDYKRKQISYQRQNQTKSKLKTLRRERGIGISCGFQTNGIYHKRFKDPQYSIKMEMLDEKNLKIFTSAIADSARTPDLWKLQAAQLLGLQKRNVSLINTNTDVTPNSGPPFLYDHLYTLHKLIHRGCQKIIKLKKQEKYPLSIELTMEDIDKNSITCSPFKDQTWGVATVEVELNSVTMKVEPKKIYLEIDCGVLLNKNYALQRIKTAVLQCLHWCQIDQELTSLTNKLNLTMPIAETLPKIEIILKESPLNPPKGVVELVFNILPAAFLSAASQALKSQQTAIPLSTDLNGEIL